MSERFDLHSAETRFAMETVRDAARLARRVQQEMVTAALTKSDRSPVTVADFAAQALVGYRLETAFPDDPLVGEEDSAVLRTAEQRETLERILGFVRHHEPQATSQDICRWIDRGSAESAPRFWTVDPIDGTKGFLRGDQYAVALALVAGGRVQIGVLGCPHVTDARLPEIGGPGSVVVAVRGEGCWVTPLEGRGDLRHLQVSDQESPAAARLLRSFEAAHTNTGQIGRLVAELGVEADPVPMDSQAKYALLAAGRGDLLVRLISSRAPDYRERIWDQAAGSLVVEEAGGRISDLDGKPLDFTVGRCLERNRGVLASNQRLHDAALTALRAIGA